MNDPAPLAPAPDPATREQDPQPDPDAVFIRRYIDLDGTCRVEVGTLGDVRLTEITDIIQMGAERWAAMRRSAQSGLRG